MNIPLTLSLSLTAAIGGSVVQKQFVNNSRGRVSYGFVYNCISCLAASVVLLLWGGLGELSLFTVLLGVSFGAVTALQGIMVILAWGSGPMSYTSVIVSFSTLLSALSGVMFFGESIGWAQIVGILLMLVSFVLAVERKGDEKGTNLKWLILSIIAFTATGAIGIMQKVHQSSSHKGELNGFLVIAFCVSAVFSLIFAFLFKMREDKKESEGKKAAADKKRILMMLALMFIGGVCVACNNKFNLYLSGVMDSAVFFPIVNGGGLVLTTLAAVLLFKERLTKKQWIGICIGILSVVFLCDPF